MRVAAVVPTCRGFAIPKQTIPVEWYVVHDQERREIEGEATHIVAPEPKFYGRHCDSIRSAGFLAAYKDGADFILTVDDDCHIPPSWAEEHVFGLQQEHHRWWPTTPLCRTRGLPYGSKLSPVAITHGLWDGVPDLDAKTQQQHPKLRIKNLGNWYRISTPFTQSAMNLGFRREVTCVMYQPFQGPDTPFDRFADIWAGVIGQYCLAQHRYSFLTGGAVVTHDRASSLETNLIKEAPGLRVHEDFWQYIWRAHIKGLTLPRTYALVADYVSAYLGENTEQDRYFERVGENMHRWIAELGEQI